MRKYDCGIYEGLNVYNQKRYIGRSVNVLSRIRGHIRTLRQGKNQNQYLQSAWNKYGETAFSWRILLRCEPVHLAMYEKLIIEAYQSHRREFGYNNMGATPEHYFMSDEMRRKQSMSRLGCQNAKGHRLTEESKLRISQKIREFDQHDPSRGRRAIDGRIKNRLEIIQADSILNEAFISGRLLIGTRAIAEYTGLAYKTCLNHLFNDDFQAKKIKVDWIALKDDITEAMNRLRIYPRGKRRI